MEGLWNEMERKDEHAYICERRYGSFLRSFRMPDDMTWISAWKPI